MTRQITQVARPVSSCCGDSRVPGIDQTIEIYTRLSLLKILWEWLITCQMLSKYIPVLVEKTR